MFVGAVEFSRHCLTELLRLGAQVAGVVTLAPELAGHHADFADLGPVAEASGIPVVRVRRVNDRESAEAIRAFRPDVLFVFGWSQVLSCEILRSAPLGCIGSHPALLPQHRGRHPLIWALVEGLEESGLTFFYMDEGVDSGDILWQRPFPITLEDDASTLYRKVELLATEAIAEFLPQLCEGRVPRVPQDHAKATYWRKRDDKDGEIQWGSTTLQVYNLIRALTRPYVGAHTFLGSSRVRIWRSRLLAEQQGTGGWPNMPGAVLMQTDGGFIVRTGDGCLEVTEHEVLGEGRLSVGTVLRNST